MKMPALVLMPVPLHPQRAAAAQQQALVRAQAQQLEQMRRMQADLRFQHAAAHGPVMLADPRDHAAVAQALFLQQQQQAMAAGGGAARGGGAGAGPRQGGKSARVAAPRLV